MYTRYYPLINKALTFFNLKEDITVQAENSFTRPFITIAREPGSGGAPIAEAIAEKLGFEFVDEQIIDEIARSTKKRKAIIKAIDEKHRTKIEDVVHSVLNAEYIDDSAYITELIKVVLAYAYKGKCVILGRGANFITPFAKGLHVNITAPYNIRVQRAIDYEGHNMAKAREIIAKVEKERNEFVKQYFKKDPKKVNSYDLTINTTYCHFDQARDIIIEAFFQKFKHSVKT
ncbi:MAG: cytidylate kinase-like family protein [Pseudomonadales bacterium]|nr:cytidylate kinase-like family protein [Candidatus Woesebacteria bacterium]MCB9800617.1 cytidylate kinase-like family protein [Pseudomonadales bacterium]